MNCWDWVYLKRKEKAKQNQWEKLLTSEGKKKKPYIVMLHTTRIHMMVHIDVIKNAIQLKTKGKH